MAKSRNLMFIPLAFIKGYNTGNNIINISNTVDIYLKNVCVALISAKRRNPEDDVALVTNMDEIPFEYKELLNRNNVLILKELFDDFIFDKTLLWSLAYYKLCALKKIVQNYQYENYMYLDSDVFVRGSFESIWKEAKEHILLYKLVDDYSDPGYEVFWNEVEYLFPKIGKITYYGGEFFAGNKENVELFVEKCNIIYNKMISNNYNSRHGDEFITSIAANLIKQNVEDASEYVGRYWTRTFRQIDLYYKYNHVIVIHVPSEKEHGMLRIYEKYYSLGKTISNQKAYKLLHLESEAIDSKISRLIGKLISTEKQVKIFRFLSGNFNGKSIK